MTMLDAHGVSVIADKVARAATLNTDVADAFTTAVNAAILAGFEEAPDTTEGWVTEISVSDFQEAKTFHLDNLGRLDLLPRGGTAEQVPMRVVRSDWHVHRFGKTLRIDEEDLLDDRQVGVLLQAAKRLGSLARQIRPDLVYSLLLENPSLTEDSTALFHADHSNLGNGALSAANLGTGMAAVAKQVVNDHHGPIHLGLRPRFLVVPPDLDRTARATINGLRLEQPELDLIVRPESRVSDVSVYDAIHDVKRTGTTTNWFLAAPATAWPSIIIGYLGGQRTPKVRSYPLSEGEFGFAWDVSLDMGVTVVDYRPVYKSTGTV
jgi:hypothetical protein